MLIWTGVTVSIVPRNALNPTKDTNVGMNEKDRITKYGFANRYAGAPSGNTDLSTYRAQKP
jgi:hypothetical protein